MQALRDFQRRCSVSGMIFASVPAGPGSSGGPLINQRGEVEAELQSSIFMHLLTLHA